MNREEMVRSGSLTERAYISGSSHVVENDDVDEAALIEAAKSGDRQAFGRLYALYGPPVLRLARFRAPASAEDVVAETFTRAWAALPRYKDKGRPFSAWLYAIARNVITDLHRKNDRVVVVGSVPEDAHEVDHTSPLWLSQVLARLPEDQRKVIEMKYLMDMDNASVAKVMRKSIGAVNALQWRALRSLNLAMEDDR